MFRVIREAKGIKESFQYSQGAAFWEDKLDLKSSDLKSLKRMRTTITAIWQKKRQKKRLVGKESRVLDT